MCQRNGFVIFIKKRISNNKCDNDSYEEYGNYYCGLFLGILHYCSLKVNEPTNYKISFLIDNKLKKEIVKGLE